MYRLSLIFIFLITYGAKNPGVAQEKRVHRKPLSMLRCGNDSIYAGQWFMSPQLSIGTGFYTHSIKRAFLMPVRLQFSFSLGYKNFVFTPMFDFGRSLTKERIFLNGYDYKKESSYSLFMGNFSLGYFLLVSPKIYIVPNFGVSFTRMEIFEAGDKTVPTNIFGTSNSPLIGINLLYNLEKPSKNRLSPDDMQFISLSYNYVSPIVEGVSGSSHSITFGFAFSSGIGKRIKIKKKGP